MAEANDPGFGIYLHWPFCAAKCPYCDFNSHVRRGSLDEAAFVAALGEDLRFWNNLTPERTVGTVFFGGGTPSLMTPQSVAALIELIAKLWPLAPDAEITLEANPSSAEQTFFAGYRSAGVNRLSLGVQALRDDDLRALGRLHDAAEARAALAMARNVFGRVSFDMIYARPGQSAGDWRAELTEALAMADGHLSVYQLTIEPGTPFAARHAAGKLKTPDSRLAADLYDVTQELCEAAGFRTYEISNHAQPGEECRHNLLYWRYGDFAGAGPGAHGRLSLANGAAALIGEALGQSIEPASRIATTALSVPERWAERVAEAGHGLAGVEPLDPAQQADEMVVMGMRLAEGLDLSRLARTTGRTPNLDQLQPLFDAGLLQQDAVPDRLVATASGRAVLDSLVVEISQSF